MDWAEVKLRFCLLAYFALGAMWAVILIYTYGTWMLPQFVFAGIVIVGFASMVGRLARRMWDAFRRGKIWKNVR